MRAGSGIVLSMLEKAFAWHQKFIEKTGDMMDVTKRKGWLPLIFAGCMTVPLLVISEMISFVEFGRF